MTPSEGPTQIVLIMTDTQRRDMVGCYGNADMKTPNLDRLAEQGVRFDRCYTCSPVCGPARSAMFTGLFPHSNGGWANHLPLGDTVKTIGQRVHDQGVRAAYIGKWHLDGGDYFGNGRCPEGWDERYWYDMRCYLEELSPEDRLRSRQMQTCEDPSLTADFTFAHRCSNRAIDFLEKHRDESFLLVVSYDEPHHPFLCPRPYAEMYRGYEWPTPANAADTLEGKPAHQRVWAETSGGAPPHIFYGCNSFVDDEIGRVLDAVDRCTPDSLVIYTSDHGEMLGGHGLYGKGPAMYEEVTGVPLLVRWPGVAPAGTSSPHPVSHIDLVPTMLDVFGLPMPRWVEGRSLTTAFSNPDTRINPQVFMEFGRYEVDHDGFGAFQPIRCIFDGRYKLVVNLMTSDELYDHETDPDEMHNLIDSPDHAAARDALHDRLLAWMAETRDPFRGDYWERRPWRSDARPASWDYTGMTRQREHEEYEPRQLDYVTGLAMTEAVRPK